MKNSILYNSMIMLLLFAISLNVYVMINPAPSINQFEEDLKSEIEQEIIEEEKNEVQVNEEKEQELPNCPAFRDALSAYEYASKILATQKNLYVAGFGSVSAAGGLGNQSIKTIKKIDDSGNIYCESVSKKAGMFGVNVAEATLYKNDGYILKNNTKDISDSLVANYSGTYQKVSVDSYLKDYKLLPWERSYDINASSISQSSITFNGKVFKCSMILNKSAVARYGEKIKKSSDAKSLPNFSSITVNFTIDIKGRFVSFSSSDSYVIDLGVSASVSQNLTETYYYKKVVIDEV